MRGVSAERLRPFEEQLPARAFGLALQGSLGVTLADAELAALIDAIEAGSRATAQALAAPTRARAFRRRRRGRRRAEAPPQPRSRRPSGVDLARARHVFRRA